MKRKNEKPSRSLDENDRRRSDRRQFHRFPVVGGLIEPITLQLDGAGKSPRNQPAILTNLSAGGMSLILFAEPPRTRLLEMVLSLPGLSEVAVEGKVVHVNEKGRTYKVGIAFNKISRKHQSKIVAMAQDNMDCATRISLGLPESCVPKCHFHELCMKPQKDPSFWK